MTVIQNLVKASAAFAAAAPVVPPAAPSADLVTAFRRYRYWYLRWLGSRSGTAHLAAKSESAAFAAGYFAGIGEDPLAFEYGDTAAGRWDKWDAHRANSRHWADRPARIKAAILAASPLTPEEAEAAAHALDGVTRR